jgi:repressor LexA
MHLTRRQQEIYTYLRDHQDHFAHPPSLDELCQALGMRSKGSLHKHIQALIDAGLVEPMEGRRRGIRLMKDDQHDAGIPLLGKIAAGQPIEAMPQPEFMAVPDALLTGGNCYVLMVEGESMIDAGIFDGDYVVIESREQARNGEIVVALVDREEATLKRIEQAPGKVILHPANSSMSAMTYQPDQVQIQGVLVGLLRKYP